MQRSLEDDQQVAAGRGGPHCNERRQVAQVAAHGDAHTVAHICSGSSTGRTRQISSHINAEFQELEEVCLGRQGVTEVIVGWEGRAQ